MKKENKLNIDEVMALVMFGMPTTKIRKTILEEFDRLYDENPELEGYLEKANKILDKQEVLGIKSLSVQDEGFPERLLKIGDDCPAVIHLLGNAELLKEQKDVAIIGARSADKEGSSKAYQLGKKYAQEGNVIVSGLALGCDTAGHNGCLDVGGKTIAIVGSGLDIVHPKENVGLQKRILENGGLILSEQPLGVKASPRTLVQRNRLQAALSESIILAQCPAESGSLHTMSFARKYRKKSLAMKYAKRTEANAGNCDLIENNLAEPLEI